VNIEDLAARVIQACEEEGAAHMVTGAFAFNYYGIPRATRDVDIVVELLNAQTIPSIIRRLEDDIEFSGQVQFDTATWGKRHVGSPRDHSLLKVELFELFDDPFVLSQFRRRVRLASPQLHRELWLPTAEDIVVQKLRWARSKDLDDARDVLAVQGIDTLDVSYIERWCTELGIGARLSSILRSLPEM